MTSEVSQTDHLCSPRPNPRKPLSRPALRGGVVREGGACDPLALSCTIFDRGCHLAADCVSLASVQARKLAHSVAPPLQTTTIALVRGLVCQYCPLRSKRPPAISHTALLLLLSQPQPLRWVAGWDARESRHKGPVLRSWPVEGYGPPSPRKGHTGPHGRLRGALCLHGAVCLFSVLSIPSLFVLFYPIAL